MRRPSGIVTHPHPVLGRPSERVVLEEPISPSARYLSTQMAYAMVTENGLGVACCQIGTPLTTFIVAPGIIDREATVVFNPVVMRCGLRVGHVEGCLSLPGRSYDVPRWSDVVLLFHTYDDSGRLVAREEELRGIAAFVVQHEEDHLRGVLISDIGTRIGGM